MDYTITATCSLVCISSRKTIWTGITLSFNCPTWMVMVIPSAVFNASTFTLLRRICKCLEPPRLDLHVGQPIITTEAEKSLGPSPVLCEWLCDSFVIRPMQLPYSFKHYWPMPLRLDFVSILNRRNIKLINGEERQRGSIVCSLPFQSMFKSFLFF